MKLPLINSIRNKTSNIGFFILSLFLISGSLPALAINELAASVQTNQLASLDSLITMSITLFGGLAFFLYGIQQMSDSLSAVAGERMKIILGRLTTNRMMGALSGAFVTSVIQSSTLTSVLVVGFVSAGLMSLSQSIGVIMGANIGTTLTAQIIAFKITKLALLFIGLGFTTLFVSANRRIKQYGTLLMGLGLVFYGLNVMSEAMQPLRSYPPFLDLMSHMHSPILGILIAALFTALVQSSSATTGIIIVMASQGLISLPAGIALAFGANIGTCVTALLASIGKTREAVRAAMIHVIFNISGVIIWLWFIPQLAELVMWISPAHPELFGMDRLSAETPRQIANAHTIFNIANTFIFIGFCPQFARLVEYLVPDKQLVEETPPLRAEFLDDALLTTPSLALERVRLEVNQMGEIVQQMVDEILPAIISGDRQTLTEIGQKDDQVDQLYALTLGYLGQIGQRSLNEQQTKEMINLMSAVNDLENIGDTVETNLVELGYARIATGVLISEHTKKVLWNFQALVQPALKMAIQSVASNDPELAQQVIEMKAQMIKLADSAAVHQAARLVAKEPKRIPAYTIEKDIMEKQKRIYHFARRMAKSVHNKAQRLE